MSRAKEILESVGEFTPIPKWHVGYVDQNYQRGKSRVSGGFDTESEARKAADEYKSMGMESVELTLISHDGKILQSKKV